MIRTIVKYSKLAVLSVVTTVLFALSAALLAVSAVATIISSILIACMAVVGWTVSIIVFAICVAFGGGTYLCMLAMDTAAKKFEEVSGCSK